MIRALSTAASGMDAQQTRLDVTSNNIANATTPGFKKSRAEFQDLVYQNLRGATAPSGSGTTNGLQVGMGVRVIGTQRMQTAGDVKQTGNALDVSIDGNGFFGVTLPDGTKGYSRDGGFKLSADGKIVNNDGYPLSGDITIPPGTTTITISPEGSITALVPPATTPAEVGKIELAGFANPAGLTAAGRNLFRETVASGTAATGLPGQNGLGTLSQNSLELSNVKVVEEMVDLISGQRAYEINSRVIKAADEMLQQTANLR